MIVPAIARPRPFKRPPDFEIELSPAIPRTSPVSGAMNGVAEDNAFNFAISGTYNPTTEEMKIIRPLRARTILAAARLATR